MRQPLLNDLSIPILYEAIRDCMSIMMFKMEAIVILPDHIHSIWNLPPTDDDYSSRWKLIKNFFTKEYIRRVGGTLVEPIRPGRVGEAKRNPPMMGGDKGQVEYELNPPAKPSRVGAALAKPSRVGGALAKPSRVGGALAKPSRVGGALAKPTSSMQKKGEKGIWQRRFWEHTIRDERDYSLHCDYIHYNPVKHGLVKSPLDWAHSSFHEFVRKGIYPESWGGPVKGFPEEIGGE